MKKELKKLIKTGFFSIFLSSVLSKILVFIGGTLVVRVLSKNDYGVYAYVLNCISMLTLFNDFGASSAALQFLTEEQENYEYKGKVINYTFKVTILSSLFSCLLIAFSSLFYPFTIDEAKGLTRFLFMLPLITTIGGLFPTIIRSNLDNKKYAIFQIFSTFVSYLFLIGLSYFFGLNGAICSQYVYNVAILLFGLYLSFIYLKKYRTKNILDKKAKKEFLKFSFASQVNNTIAGLLIIVDTFVIGLLISDPNVIATYKVGSAIPHALTFISSCVAVYIIPYFIKNNKNYKWLKSNFKKMLLYGTIGYGLIFGLITVCASMIIKIMYGNEYLSAVPVFIILMVGLFFTSAYKVPAANMLHSMKKIKINIIVNIVSIILNAILNVIFIKKFGFVGAAITTTFINIFSSLFYVIYLLKNFKDVGDNK